MAVEARAPCGDCNNNNNNNNNNKVTKVILVKIITDGNLTLIKRLIKKKYCTYIISVKKEKVGLGGSRMGTKENKTVFIGVLRKKWKHCYSEIFFP
jgi:signal recognition particle receptor subunit beta